MLDWLEQAFGALLVLLVLLDVFLTVLYARIGASLISGTVARVTWRLFLWLSKPLGQNRAVALSCCGPAILVLLVAIWAFGLTCGTALIIHPKLGTSVRVSSGDTPTDFVTAMYAGGSSVAIVGASDFTPHTSAFRMLFLFNSLVGMSVLSLTLTYLMQVYTAPAACPTHKSHPTRQHKTASAAATSPRCDGSGRRAFGPRPTNTLAPSATCRCAPTGIVTSRRLHHPWPTASTTSTRSAATLNPPTRGRNSEGVYAPSGSHPPSETWFPEADVCMD
jgi:hypothetical protein